MLPRTAHAGAVDTLCARACSVMRAHIRYVNVIYPCRPLEGVFNYLEAVQGDGSLAGQAARRLNDGL